MTKAVTLITMLDLCGMNQGYDYKKRMNKNVLYEFSKLDSIDLRVATWLHCKCPRVLYSYLEFIAENDYRRKGANLNTQKIYDELQEVYVSTTSSRERNYLWESSIFKFNR